MSWKPVTVELAGDDHGDDTKNHYDNEKLSRKARHDLPVNPGEDVGMFYGLEVCHDYGFGDGSFKAAVKKLSPEPVGAKKRKRSDGNKTAKDDSAQTQKDHPEHGTKTKKKKKKKQSESAASPVHTKEPRKIEAAAVEPIDQNRFVELQQAWGNALEPSLVESLYRQNFLQPTPIQAETLNAAILGRRNIVGAAPTGSGKTLAFILPILNHIMQAEKITRSPQAVIVTPTRELATQIQHECDKLKPNQCVTLVGGIAIVKQTRLLQTKRPPIIIGTPGRLWAMLSSGEHEHLNDLTQIRFLVLDEADRMAQEHCFPQLLSILESINDANPCEKEDDDDASSSGEDEEDGSDRMFSLPGLRGEAKVMMLTDDVLRQIEEQKRSTSKPQPMEVPNREFGGSESSDNDQPKVHRQTLIFSATLTLPVTSLNEKRRRRASHGLDGAIAEILERAHSMGETKIVDLSSSSNVSLSQPSGGVRLPPGLVLEQVKCTQLHKDSHLYAYLMTTAQGSSGPCLVFCNSIAAVRRLGKTLECLRFSVRIMHAQMQQRARFKAVESLKDSKTRAVVVCTDVAARGLDIPSVATVVHYDVARSVDAFVHRSGRTARGMGQGAVGTSLSLISPAEDKSHSKIVEALQVTFSKVYLDGRLMTAAQERTNLASKIFLAGELQQKTHSSNKWFLDAAKEADLEIDDDLLEDESNMSEKDALQLKEVKKAKLRLGQLLSEPMKTQRFGKFLSTNSAFMQAEIKPLLGKPVERKVKKKKRKSSG